MSHLRLAGVAMSSTSLVIRGRLSLRVRFFRMIFSGSLYPLSEGQLCDETLGLSCAGLTSWLDLATNW